MHLWFPASAGADQYKSAAATSGLETFIAAYRHTRLSNSWTNGCSCTDRLEGVATGGITAAPALTGLRCKDAQAWLDRLLTAPLLWLAILLVVKLPADK